MARKSLFSVEENLSHTRGTEWNEIQAGTSSGATATKAAISGMIHKVCQLSGHTDKDSLVQILDGSTVIFEVSRDVDVEGKTFHFTFPEPLQSTAGNAMSAVVADSTSDCFVSFGGFSDLSY